MLYTGVHRDSAPILAAQDAQKTLELKHQTKKIGQNILNVFESGRLDDFGYLMDEHWALKRKMSAKMSNDLFDEIYEEAKKQVNFFAKTDYKGKPTTFGILKNDRRRHVYIIGKTGTGKSTMLMNMAINDIRNGEGVGVIDPHGETAETLLEFVPSYRVNDVIYFNPSDTDYPFHLNPLEITDPSQKDIIASGIVAIFYKLFAQSWGPRLEYILRNTILTLLEVPNSTLLQIPELLTNAHFRNKAVDQITDPVVKAFWKNEFDKMSENFRNEAVSPILNKVGQFLSSPIIRNIVGQTKSTIDLRFCMDKGKIVAGGVPKELMDSGILEKVFLGII